MTYHNIGEEVYYIPSGIAGYEPRFNGSTIHVTRGIVTGCTLNMTSHDRYTFDGEIYPVSHNYVFKTHASAVYKACELAFEIDIKITKANTK